MLFLEAGQSFQMKQRVKFYLGMVVNHHMIASAVKLVLLEEVKYQMWAQLLRLLMVLSHFMEAWNMV